jgi:hypothetical protein
MRLLPLVLLVVLLLLGCPSKQTASEPPKPPSGLVSITEADLTAHVTELASDAYRGRETLTAGADAAAKYLSDRFAALGLEPLPGADGHVVPYTLVRTGFLADGTSLARGGDSPEDFVAGVDFAPFGFSDSGAVDAELVFAGYGISSEDPAYDDYAGLDVTGKVVLVLRHTPNEDDAEAPLTGSALAFFRTKAETAQKKGALGMVLLTDPKHHEDADDLRLPARLRLPPPPPEPVVEEKPASEKPTTEPAGPKEEEPIFLAMRMSQEAAGRLVDGGLETLRAAQDALDTGTPAAAVGMVPRGPVSLRVAAMSEPEIVHPNNVVGVLPGADPERRDELVVVGAHFDHLGGFNGEGDTVFNGADDNASGTAGLLELAEAFAHGARPARTLVFAGFSGEEKGLLGSKALLAEGTLAAEDIVFMLNLDMIGRNGAKPVRVTGDGYGTGLQAITEAANEKVELPLAFGGTEYSGNSDHHPFFLRDIPVMFFFSGLHDDYHQLSDHVDLIDPARMRQIVQVGYGVLAQVASGAATPKFIHHVLWLGAEVRVTDGGGAARVMVVEEGSRGAKAGLLVGDHIVGFDGVALETPAAVGEALREIEPGSTTEIALQRGDATASVTVERAKRGYLGVSPRGVSDDVKAEHGLADDEGVRLARVVAKGPAAAAGLLVEDVLIRIAGVPVGPRSLGRHLARIGAGETVDVVVIRAGERMTLKLTLGERPKR